MKLLMKKIIAAILMISPVLFFSCKSGGEDPKTVLSKFFVALSKKDIAAARKLSTTESKDMLDKMELSTKGEKQHGDDNKFDPKTMEMGDVKINGDRATIAVKETSSGETINYVLRKQEGNW